MANLPTASRQYSSDRQTAMAHHNETRHRSLANSLNVSWVNI